MFRYTCGDCKTIHRARNTSTIRCRKCVNKRGGIANRPNRAIHGQWKTNRKVKVSTPPKTGKKQREHKVD